MKPFRFSLQPVRVLREQKEQKAQQAFGEAMRRCDEAAFQLQTASDELVAGWNSLCRDISGGSPASQLTRTRAWCNVLELRQKDRAEALQQARRAMESALKQMTHATRDREVLDTCHDKRRDSYDRDVQREDRKNLDELGARRAATSTGFGSLHRLNRA